MSLPPLRPHTFLVDEIAPPASGFLAKCIEERNRFEEDVTGKVPPPLPRGLVIDGLALLEAMRTPESQGALLRAAQVRGIEKNDFTSALGNC